MSKSQTKRLKIQEAIKNLERCPSCHGSWIDKPIPEKDREFFGGATHFRRVIGIDGGRMGIYDGVVAYRCPDCGTEFPRSNTPWALEMFEKYKRHEKI